MKSLTVEELITELRGMSPDAEVSAFTEVTVTYGEGCWVHVGKVTEHEWGVCLEEAA